MSAPLIRLAGKPDVPRLNAALAKLSADIGDRHAATDADLERAGFGPAPVFRAMIAERGREIVALALYSPVFSTVRAGAGLYISDLWVDQSARGMALGRRITLAAARDAEKVWSARFVRLVVYRDNAAARGFYERLGFSGNAGELLLTLDAEGLDALEGAS